MTTEQAPTEHGYRTLATASLLPAATVFRQWDVAELSSVPLPHAQSPGNEVANRGALAHIGILLVEQQPAVGDDGIGVVARGVGNREAEIVRCRCRRFGKRQLSRLL